MTKSRADSQNVALLRVSLAIHEKLPWFNSIPPMDTSTCTRGSFDHFRAVNFLYPSKTSEKHEIDYKLNGFDDVNILSDVLPIDTLIV